MLRKITSLTSLFSLIILTLTSIVLYFVPQGRVAYWADWTFIGLSKEQWGDVHICTGVLFIFASMLHIWLNWKPILAYLKKKGAAKNFTSPAFFISLAITLFVAFGTLAGISPMKDVLEFSSLLKDMGQEKYGVPPYGHAELSPLNIFCKRMGLDADQAVASIRNAGHEVSSAKESIKDIARRAGLTPKELHEIILKDQPDKKKSSDMIQNKEAKTDVRNTKNGTGTGIGRMSLANYCSKNELDINIALSILNEKGILADRDTTIREISAKLGLSSPHEVVNLLKPDSTK